MKAKKSKRLAIIMKHQELIRAGKYFVAYKLLRLLQTGSINLYMGDYDMEAERILEKIGCRIVITRQLVSRAYDFGY